MGESSLNVLKDLDLEVSQGEFVSILGRSGSGKSTLLQILGCLDLADSGQYLLDGVDVFSLNDEYLSQLRAKKLGFVFQSFCLLPHLNVLRNVMVPMLYAGVPVETRESTAKDWLIRMGLGHRLYHRPSQLSGGERQRVAIARSMVNSPKLLLADEPTGNLDSEVRDLVFDELRRLQKEENVSLIIVTHDQELGYKADRALKLQDGRLCGL